MYSVHISHVSHMLRCADRMCPICATLQANLMSPIYATLCANLMFPIYATLCADLI